MVGFDVVQLTAVCQQPNRQVVQPDRLLLRCAVGVVVTEPVAGLVVKRIGVGGAQIAAYLLASAVVAVFHDRGACALDLGHATGGVVQVFACLAADGEGVAHLVIGARHACHRTQTMVGGWICVGLHDATDLGTQAIAGDIVAVAANHGIGGAVFQRCEPTEGVVIQSQLRCRVAGRGQSGEVANSIEAEADFQAACAGVLDDARW